MGDSVDEERGAKSCSWGLRGQLCMPWANQPGTDHCPSTHSTDF